MKVRGRPRRVSWRFIVFTLLVLTVFSSVQTFSYVENNLRPAFMRVAEKKTRMIATDAINDSISKRIALEANYEKLVDLRTGSDGKITAGFFNMQEATRVQYSVTQAIQEVLQNLEQEEIMLPMGQAFSSTLLSSVGPEIPVKITPSGTVHSNVRWETHDVGINQTVHVLYLEIDVRSEVVIPFATKPTQIETRVPIAYLVMLGDVPQMVFNSQGESMRSIPTNAIMPPIQLPDLNRTEEAVQGEQHEEEKSAQTE